MISTGRGKVKSKTVRNIFYLKFVLKLSYCRIFMRHFWTYFMFADFMTVILIDDDSSDHCGSYGGLMPHTGL